MPVATLNKATASILAGAICVLMGNVLNHVDLTIIPDGWGRWLVAALKQSDSMTEVQTIITTAVVYFTRNQTANS